MKSPRFILTALLAAALTGGVLTATDSMARPHFTDPGYGCYGCPGGYGPGYGWNGNSGLTSEQQEKYTKIVQDYARRMEPIQDQIFVKRQELRALRNATNPDVKTVRETATELTKLNKQLGDLHDEMAQRIEKEVGRPAGAGANSGNYGPGYHHGMGCGYGMGYGHRMGYGMGYGQGMMDNN
ncbi:periplasmic heavy metal sensor [Desulfovibrio sp. ZJ369]|uniref:Spy/CpxP family protein refolding chaperone n=1 Tax=Desulfovibrio sp. ZJ369 TaxID=2709793 RepID=UPI0013EC0553|nr:periplasmic heavy metal sensor [Desulfovibrio sp. ZJ369]